MNKQRRKAIADLIELLEGITRDLDGAHEDSEDIGNDESEYLENMPENMKQGERGEAASAAADALAEATGALESAREAISEAMDSLRTAAEG